MLNSLCNLITLILTSLLNRLNPNSISEFAYREIKTILIRHKLSQFNLNDKLVEGSKILNKLFIRIKNKIYLYIKPYFFTIFITVRLTTLVLFSARPYITCGIFSAPLGVILILALRLVEVVVPLTPGSVFLSGNIMMADFFEH